MTPSRLAKHAPDTAPLFPADEARSPARTPRPVSAPAATPAAREARELWIAVHVPACEAPLLERLATHAQRYTPRVTLVPPDGLLLEVQGSLRLFGGAHRLREAVEADCARLAGRAATALAPTPYAALAGARGGAAFAITDSARLVGGLAALPLGVLRWPEETIDRLTHIGVRTIGQALRLPRTGFARRFGAAQLEALDRLVGRRADPQRAFRPRERFLMRREPPCELEHHEAILVSLAEPLDALERFLRARQCGVTELIVRLHHRNAPPTRCTLSLAAPEADAVRLRALLAEKLARLALPEAVRVCELRSGALLARASASSSLWQPGEHGGGAGSESPAFIERLRTRLGGEAVHGLELFPEHRPEVAWRLAPCETALARRDAPVRSRAGARIAQTPWPPGSRPLWLLPQPQQLVEHGGQPRHRGLLRLLGEPERIETGWWDGGDIARDYYVAVDPRGARLWVFRERIPPHRWFLHGVFG